MVNMKKNITKRNSKIAGSKLWSIAMITSLLAACGSPVTTSTAATSAGSTTGTSQTASDSKSTLVKYTDLVSLDADDTNVSWTEADSTLIKLNGKTATATGVGASGVKAADGSVTISKAGTYVLSGELTDGQIVVNVANKGVVQLVLNGASIHDNDSAGIFIQQAGKAVITLEKGTKNSVSDGKTYVYADKSTDEPDAAIFSKADLTFNGAGQLTVTGNYNEGITSKDDLKIISGSISVKAADDGIKGKDMVAIQAGTIKIDAAGDGIKSNNDKDINKGFVAIADGTFNIVSGSDGIQAETTLVMDGGTFNIETAGGSVNAPAKVENGPGGRMGFGGDRGEFGRGGPINGTTPPANMGTPREGEPPADINTSSTTTGSDAKADADNAVATTEEESTSAKALKAGTELTVNGGTYTIDSMDDSLHSNSNVTVNGGTFTIQSGDDGIHADQALTINGGTIKITKSYEGLEGAIITLNDGDVDVISSDDGVNASGGEATKSDTTAKAASGSTSATNTSKASTDTAAKDTDANQQSRGPKGIPGRTSSNNELRINGGFLTVNADGDGLDSNGSITMTGGTVIVNGPTASGNGALDYDGTFVISGGYLIAAGSSGMAQGTSDTSTQNTLVMTFPETQKAGTLIHVQDSKGNNIVTFAPAKNYQNVVISSPNLTKDGSYVVYSGGTSTGKAVDGLYTGGTYSGGKQFVAFQSTSNVTWVNESGVTTARSGMGGFGGGGRGAFDGARNRRQSDASTGTNTGTNTGTTSKTEPSNSAK